MDFGYNMPIKRPHAYPEKWIVLSILDGVEDEHARQYTDRKSF